MEIKTNNPDITITGKISNKESALAAFGTMQENLQAANKEDLDSYVATLISNSREETKEELVPFFKDYDLENTLLTFEIKKQETDHQLVEVTQKTVNTGNKEYKSHIATTNVTFKKENNQWLIEESVVTNTKFI